MNPGRGLGESVGKAGRADGAGADRDRTTTPRTTPRFDTIRYPGRSKLVAVMLYVMSAAWDRMMDAMAHVPLWVTFTPAGSGIEPVGTKTAPGGRGQLDAFNPFGQQPVEELRFLQHGVVAAAVE